MARLRVLKNGQPMHDIEIKKEDGLLVGRSESCQLVLDHDVVSRSHFKIVWTDEQWILERLTKYGSLLYGDNNVSIQPLQNGDSFAVPPYLFTFEDIKSETLGAKPQQERSTLESNDNGEPQDSSNETDSTSVEVVRAVPYLTLQLHGSQETLRLEGQSWIAGRDEDCELSVNDPRCSREHCRIYRTGLDFFVIDLGSSNGTYVNDTAIADQPKGLQSGDRIQIGDTVLVFELRDPLYEQMISDLQPEQPVNNSPVMYIPINMSPTASPGTGAIRMDGQTEPLHKKGSAKLMRISLMVVILGLIVYALMDDGGQQKTMASKSPTSKGAKSDPFLELSKDDQEFVKRTYALAKNLFMQTKYELALAEIRKVNAKVPSYLDSKDIEDLCQNAMQTIANQKYEEELERRQKEAIENSKRIANECQNKFMKSTDLAAAEACFAPALEFDPENSAAKKTTDAIRNRIEQKDLEKTNKAEFLRRAKTREALYERAKQLQSQGRLIDAIDAYGRHIASALPDPKKLEDKSKQGVSNIKTQIKSEMDKAIQASEDHLANAEYKEVIVALEKALELDPNNERARQIYDQASKELFKKMKALFSDSVVEESLGNVEPAKIKWRKIVEQDSPKGEYRQKATIKLKKYGE